MFINCDGTQVAEWKVHPRISLILLTSIVDRSLRCVSSYQSDSWYLLSQLSSATATDLRLVCSVVVDVVRTLIRCEWSICPHTSKLTINHVAVNNFRRLVVFLAWSSRISVRFQDPCQIDRNGQNDASVRFTWNT